MKLRNCATALGTALLMVAGLSGCGGGGGSSSTPATGTTVTVSPSLGKFSAGAKVTLKKPDGTVVGTADTTASGTASINVGSYAGPLVIEVAGAVGVKYYDEGAAGLKDFGAGELLLAITPSVQASVGVTPATHAAVEAIKADNGGSVPATISTSTIGDANAKIATALGISDVLQPPKLVDASTSTTLDVANVADKYALQLAALAKLAGTGKTALDVAKEIAKDLKDGKLDGKEGSVDIPNRVTDYTAETVSTKMADKLKSAANDLGNADTKTLVENDPTVAGKVNPDVTKVVAPIPGVQLAKAMFAELRTTLNSFSNASKTGFLDVQAVRASDDMKRVVTPEADKLSLRLSTIGMAVRTYEAAQTATASNGSVTIKDLETPSAWISQVGSVYDVVNNQGPFQYCLTSFPLTNSSTVTCLSAASGALTSGANTKVKFVKFVLTPTGNGTYSYTAARENRVWNPTARTLGAATTPTLSNAATIPTGSGTVTKTGTTGFSMAGTLPPTATYADGTQAGEPSSGVDTVAVAATRTTLSSGNIRYALNGSVATTTLASPPATVTLSLDAGSYIDLDETSASGSQGPKMLGFNFVGTVSTAATKLTGTLAMSGLTSDKSGTQTTPSSMLLAGSISDLSSKGAGEILKGKLETTTTGYADYDATAPEAGANYVHNNVSFTGTVQAPSRPTLKLVLSGTATAANAKSVTLNYSYGTVSITGSGTSTASSSSFTISNQDGIQIAANPNKANENLITKATTTVGTFTNGVISYVDGSSESFN